MLGSNVFSCHRGVLLTKTLCPSSLLFTTSFACLGGCTHASEREIRNVPICTTVDRLVQLDFYLTFVCIQPLGSLTATNSRPHPLVIPLGFRIGNAVSTLAHTCNIDNVVALALAAPLVTHTPSPPGVYVCLMQCTILPYFSLLTLF